MHDCRSKYNTGAYTCIYDAVLHAIGLTAFGEIMLCVYAT